MKCSSTTETKLIFNFEMFFKAIQHPLSSYYSHATHICVMVYWLHPADDILFKGIVPVVIFVHFAFLSSALWHPKMIYATALGGMVLQHHLALCLVFRFMYSSSSYTLDRNGRPFSLICISSDDFFSMLYN